MAETNAVLLPTPSMDATLPRRFADFDTFVEAVEYAARGQRGLNFYNARAMLVRTLPFRELRDEAILVAHRLSGMGFKKGDRIALIAETSAEFLIFFVACQYAGILPVPLPLPTSFGARNGYVSQLSNQMHSCNANAIMAPGYMHDIAKEAAHDMDIKFIGTCDDYLAQNKEGELDLPTSGDLSYLQYSSGSTRFPHGVSVTHSSLMANTHGMGYHGVRMQDNDRCVSWLPFYHDMGLVGSFLAAVTCQLSVDYIATEDFARRPLSWLRVMSENKGTISFSPTFGFDVCTRRVGKKTEEIAELDLSSWRVAGIGAEMIRPNVMRDFAKTFAPAGLDDKIFMPSYGLAECTLGVSFSDTGKGIEIDMVEEALLAGGRHVLVADNEEDARKREVVNCGRPLPEYELEIRDDDNHSQPDRHVGRIFVRGPSVMKEYYNDPETTNLILKDGWLDTGDMGYMRKGCIYIIGRAKDMIIVNGKNHWPQDIEWAAEQYPGVKNGDIAAISVPGENAEEIPMILAQCRESDAGKRLKFSDNLKRHVQSTTGVNIIIELVGPRALPRTSSGKLSRTKARQQFLSGGLRALAS